MNKIRGHKHPAAMLLVLVMVMTLLPATAFAEDMITSSIATATAPVITKQPKDMNATVGSSVTFIVAAEGSDLHYTWMATDGSLPYSIGEDSPRVTIKIDNLYTWKDYIFWCIVSNSEGSAQSEIASLTISESAYVLPFTDVPKSAWYYESVKGANAMGLINGKTATLYKPGDNMTYAEALKLAACMHQLYTEGDVTLTNGDPWYLPYYEYCFANGIISEESNEENGYKACLLYADANVTRSEYALWFSRALPDTGLAAVNNIQDDSIPDVSATNSVYDQAIYKLYRAGIVNGTDANGTFKPYSNIQRSEVAAILIRMMDSSVRVGAPGELSSF